MKLRLLQSGWEKLTGYLGIHLFEDGLSVNDVNEREAAQLGMFIQVAYEDGRDPNPAQKLLDNMHTEATLLGETVADDAKPEDKAAELLTREELEIIADKNGIKGLREIAEGYDVKGTSITELIEEILTAQKALVQKAEESADKTSAQPEVAFAGNSDEIVSTAIEPDAPAVKVTAKPKAKKESI